MIDFYATIRTALLAGCLPILVSGYLAPQVDASESDAETVALVEDFGQHVGPLLRAYCFDCHDADQQEAGVRLDRLDGRLAEQSLKLWEVIRDQLETGAMPPEGVDHPDDTEMKQAQNWIRRGINHARSRQTSRHGTVRRLTVHQFRNTLQELLGTEEDFASELPPDGISEDGFTGNAEVLLTSPLTIEAWFRIAEKALDAVIVNPNDRPVIQNFRMDLGRGINAVPFGDRLILGANNLLLKTSDYVVTEPDLVKPFDFDPFRMQRSFRFHEGYAGNSTVRGWRDFNSIYHAVFACMRGDRGYPGGFPYQTTEAGLLLRPAIPFAEIPGDSSRYGPKANFKVAIRELPDRGRFRVKVIASKYDDAMMLSGALKNTRGVPSDPPDENANADQWVLEALEEVTKIEIASAGVYQVDVYLEKQQPNDKKRPRDMELRLGSRRFGDSVRHPALLAVRLGKGPLEVQVNAIGESMPAERLVLTKLDPGSQTFKAFERFERQNPLLGVHLGLRRDCGHTFSNVETAQVVSSGDASAFLFEGAINNYARPFVVKGNDNYLAGVREISVRSEYTDGREMPRLLLHSVEFEGPFYESWPPRSHRKIFVDSELAPRSELYAREVLRRFSTRAFRRPVKRAELDSLIGIWRERYQTGTSFESAVKAALTAVLTSPQFLFLVEQSQGPEAEDLSPWELASKLSYFLWNGPPDPSLIKLSRSDALHAALNEQFDRMMADPRFSLFANEFVTQWLGVDRLAIVDTDRKRYPRLSPHMKRSLAEEPARFFEYCVRENLPVAELIDSEMVMANAAVASYYGLSPQGQLDLDFVPVGREGKPLGGMLAQAGVLAALSDGREANPVKRGAWFARKIIATPPDPPPPNVPELEDTTKLSLRERLERHRNVRGCIKCHEGIDPWGLVLEQYDAGGLFAGHQIDAASTLPDGTEVDGLAEFKGYLLNERQDDVAFSVAKHLATYAIGRSLTYNESRQLRLDTLQLANRGYLLGDLMRMIVFSDLFLKK